MNARAGHRVGCRRFSLGDGMILVAGSAVGIVAGQDRILGFEAGDLDPARAHTVAELILALSSLMVLAFRLRSPRPSLRRVARQPGAVACFSIVGIVASVDAYWVAAVVVEGSWRRIGPIGEWLSMLLDLNSPGAAGVVPAAWLLLVAGGRWRPEPGWIDRAGRLLGWAWIAWMAVAPLLRWVSLMIEGPVRAVIGGPP